MKNSNDSNQCGGRDHDVRMGLRGRMRLVLASLVVCCLSATVGVSSASAASLYDSLVQSSLRNLATAVESEALVDGDYSSLTVSGLADWGWTPGADESTVIHIMDAGQGWWASMQDIRGSSEFIYQSSDYAGGSTASVFKAQYQPAVAASVAGVSILGAGSELNAQALAARLQSSGITASQICDELPFLPGTHRMESSATDETLACYAAVAAGAVTAAAIVHMLMQMGSSATLEALAIDLVGDGSGAASIPTDRSKSWVDRIPGNLPEDVWDLTKLAGRFAAISSVLSVRRTLANRCIQEIGGYEQETGLASSTLQTCLSNPIFLSGNQKADEASQHDVEALAQHPRWAILTRGSNGAARGWYRNMAECKADDKTSLDCDEFPFYSTKEGGGNSTPTPSLKLISASANRSQGSSLNAFFKQCSVTDDKHFLILAVSSSIVSASIPLNSTGVC